MTRVSPATAAADIGGRSAPSRASTFAELVNAASRHGGDPALGIPAIASLLRRLARPVLSAAIVPAQGPFTRGYRTANKLGGAVLYGVVLGFVVYVVTELANRSGYAGASDPAFAAARPVLVAICIGLTVLQDTEDGRAR